MNEVIERAAAAVYGHFFCDDWPPKHAPDLGMEADAWREAVRKALAALREPTEAMVEAGVVASIPGHREAPSYPLYHPSMRGIREAFQGMIDEALK